MYWEHILCVRICQVLCKLLLRHFVKYNGLGKLSTNLKFLYQIFRIIASKSREIPHDCPVALLRGFLSILLIHHGSFCRPLPFLIVKLQLKRIDYTFQICLWSSGWYFVLIISFLFFKRFFYLFTCWLSGSLLLPGLFSRCGEWGLRSRGCARASRCCGFPCVGRGL